VKIWNKNSLDTQPGKMNYIVVVSTI